MLYIFRVDTGSMMTLEMSLALETVAHLRKSVAGTWGIPQDKQVLLISGGESLEPEERVCKYTAGSSDTNPIFLFSMASIESGSPPAGTAGEERPEERDLQPEVEASLSLPDTHNTVSVRAALAQEYVKASREQARGCEAAIHAQHLQHQGWAAALANLEDSVTALERRHARFRDTYSAYLAKREHYREVIETFDDDLHILSKIPVLPGLAEGGEPDSGHGSNGLSTGEGSRPPSAGAPPTLLDWIQQAGNHSLEQVADSCYRSLEQLDPPLLDSLSGKVEGCVDGANNTQMKEIRGLGDRLSGLEQLLLDAKRKVVEQQDLAAAFQQNQARASGLRDTSILPDLCASHRQQLLVMMRNHQHILSIRKRCVKAKEELSVNLFTRLKWVMFIQRQMAEHGQQLVLYHEELRRLSRRLEVMEQLHLAPSIYLATVVEVVRRRSYSQHYLKKAGLVATTFEELYTEEVRTRTGFQEKLNKHFLATMFPGMDDLPPDFATQQPEPFDTGLPRVSLQDLERLRADFPSLAESLSVPDRTTLSSLLTRSFNTTLTPEEGTALHSLQTITSKIPLVGAGLGSVSVMTRLCGATEVAGERSRRHRGRLGALQASRERRLEEGETDSEEETAVAGPARCHPRKLSRSLTHCAEEQTTVLRQREDLLQEAAGSSHQQLLSSSSIEPTSSSAANTNSSAAPSSDGSLLKNQWPSQTELAVQVEDKTREIDRLRGCLGAAEARLGGLEGRVAEILAVNKASLDSLRAELGGVRGQVEGERLDMMASLAELARHMVESLASLEPDAAELERAREGGEAREREAAEVRARLDTELGRLADCLGEIEGYRAELEEAGRALEAARGDLASARLEAQTAGLKARGELEEAAARAGAELRELRQRLALENELELDSYRQQLESGETGRHCALVAELAELQGAVRTREEELAGLRARTELLDVSCEERVAEEKEKIVAILEAGFSERQRVALELLERRLTEENRGKLDSQAEEKKDEMLSRLEELRQKMVDSCLTSSERLRAKLEKEFNLQLVAKDAELKKQLEVEKVKFDNMKQVEVDEVRDKVRKKSKMEMESLRSRFKMLQTTGTLETRSPSLSESELSIESPRTDSHESLASLWEGERFRFEKEREMLVQQVAEMRDEVKEARAAERLRSGAEKQVNFNEAIRRAVDEKDRRIQELELSLSGQGRQRDGQEMVASMESQLAEVQRRNTQLESELREAGQRAARGMVASFAPVPEQCSEGSDLFRQLQEENLQLRAQLTRSMTSLISAGRVSVQTCAPGEAVLVLWSDEHSNYQIYHEGSALHFLHTDSALALGLAGGAGGAGGGRRRQITAEVVDKEYCQAKKPENRFKVRVGTKFYRVRCRPVVAESLARSLLQAEPL